MNSIKLIWVVGMPGSGKTTLCKRIAAKYPFGHFSSGELLREEAATDPSLDEAMTKGELVPNEKVFDLLKKAVDAKMNEFTTFLFDGAPKDIELARKFQQSIAPVRMILLLDVDKVTAIARLMARMGTNSGRCDDNPESIAKRADNPQLTDFEFLDEFSDWKQTIDARRSVDEVFSDACSRIDKCLMD